MTRTPMTTSMIAWHCTTLTSMTTSMIAWHCTMRTPLTASTDTHMSAVRTVSSVAQHHIIRTRTAAQALSLSPHPHGHIHVSVSPRLDSPFLFPALPHVPYLLPPVPEVRGKPAHSAKREYGLHRRSLPSPQVLPSFPSSGWDYFSPVFCWVVLLFVWIMSRSILRCVD